MKILRKKGLEMALAELERESGLSKEEIKGRLC